MTPVQYNATRTEGPIYLTISDRARLVALVEGYREGGREPDNLARLEEELDRAFVVDEGRSLPSDVVTLDSRVLVVDLDSGEERLFTVVLPSKANLGEGRISVLAPLGMAVLGYRSGQEIAWDVPGGRRRLMVRRVVHQPEADARRQAQRLA